MRYIKGCDRTLLGELFEMFSKIRGRPLTQEEIDQLLKVVAKHEYGIPFAAMPMEEGIRHTRFLVELVVNHYRVAPGAPIVGGEVRIGKVTYRGTKFELLTPRVGL